MPPMEPPITVAICFTPRSSSRSLKMFTSSLIVVNGNSGPLFTQTTKNLDMSNALAPFSPSPGPPSKGPHQSPTSALPVRAWQMTMALSPWGDSVP
ncbi:hypothetical protein KC324_g8 [Hortaea werneckii]|nr:hypothetical protein KC324_g8 [Hortaea werneckii]